MSDDAQYHVVVNHQGQYAVIPASTDVPAGYKSTGVQGSKDECMDHVKTASEQNTATRKR